MGLGKNASVPGFRRNFDNLLTPGYLALMSGDQKSSDETASQILNKLCFTTGTAEHWHHDFLPLLVGIMPASFVPKVNQETRNESNNSWIFFFASFRTSVIVCLFRNEKIFQNNAHFQSARSLPPCSRCCCRCCWNHGPTNAPSSAGTNVLWHVRSSLLLQFVHTRLLRQLHHGPAVYERRDGAVLPVGRFCHGLQPDRLLLRCRRSRGVIRSVLLSRVDVVLQKVFSRLLYVLRQGYRAVLPNRLQF